MINIVLDSLLPGDTELKMPPASEVDFNSYMVKYGIQKNVTAFISKLKEICLEQFSMDFEKLNEDQKNIVLKELKLKNMRLFSDLINHVFKAYYSDKRVLSNLNVGTSPPFPNGNMIDEDDWAILLHVYERGSIYRDLDEVCNE